VWLAFDQFKRLCCKKAGGNAMDMKLPFCSAQATTSNRQAMKETCPVISPLPTPLNGPFLIMFMTSYPCNVRHAVSKAHCLSRNLPVCVVGETPVVSTQLA
jgi:hypothetical protein